MIVAPDVLILHEQLMIFTYFSLHITSIRIALALYEDFSFFQKVDIDALKMYYVDRFSSFFADWN